MQVKLKCISDFRMLSGERTFTKGQVYHGHYNYDKADGYDYTLTNDEGAVHYMPAGLITIHFTEA